MEPDTRTGDLRLLLALTLLGAAAAWLHPGSAPPAPPRLSPHRLDLRHATAAELRAVPGVGPVLAERIVDARRHAPLASRDDLLGVPGVGPVLAERLLDHGGFGDAPASRTPAEGVSAAGQRAPGR